MSTTNDILKAFWDAIKTWLAVTVCLIIIAIMISVVVRDNVRKTINEQLSVLHDQNQRSIDDRKHLNTELQNTRGSLERLEKAVKTEIMKP
jgi:septal ring factor EnvC (AmiA/AmiB activator)